MLNGFHRAGLRRNGAGIWRATGLLTLGLSIGSWSLCSQADEPAAPQLPRRPKTAAHAPIGGADDLEGPTERFKPKTAETAKEKAHKDALSWFMSGRLKQAESRFTEALSDYQAAIKADPNAVEVYRALVPLAFALNETEKGLEYARKAVELDPQDLDILRILAEQLQEQHQIEKAAEYLERASKSPKLKKDSSAYVILELQLATLNYELRRLGKAADAYAIVFDARRNPAKYNLDFQTRAALERERFARYELMGDIFLAAKHTRLSIEAYEEASKSKGGHAGPISFSLAQAYFISGKTATSKPEQAKQYEAALKQLQNYLDAQLQGRGRLPYDLLAEILKETGRGSELVGRVEELAKKDPRNSTLQYFLADQYLAANRTKDAEDLIKRIIKESGDPAGYIGLAGLYRKQNEPDKLVDALSKAFKGLKDSPDSRAQRLDRVIKEILLDKTLVDRLIAVMKKLNSADRSKPDFAGNYVIGLLALKAQRTDAAVELYGRAMEARSEYSGVLAQEIALHLAEGKRYQQAIEILKKALSGPFAPGGPRGEQLRIELYKLLSRTQEFAGKTQDSLASIREAQKLDGEDPDLQYWEAWVYSHSHQWDEAIRRYRELIKKFTADKDRSEKEQGEKARFVRLCQFTLSNCYVQKGDMATGEKILETVLAEQPDDPSVNNDLGYLYADQGKHLERAEKMIRIALKSEPKNVAYLDSMGWVLFKLGRFEEARVYLEKAIASPTGSDATIWDHLAECYSHLKARDKAGEAWTKALKDAKEDPFPDAKLIQQIAQKLKANAGNGK